MTALFKKPGWLMSGAFFLLVAVSCSTPKTESEEALTTSEQTTPTVAPAATQTKVCVKPLNFVKPIKKVRQSAETKQTEAAATPAAVQQPAPEPAFVPQIPGNRIAQVNVPGPYVALTFDDGPHGNYTPKVMDILKRYGAKATFFVLGQNAVAHKNILARAVAEGHEIGSHTWDHPSLTKLSHAAIISQMDRTAAVIREATGRAPAVMRPPYGATNKSIIDMLAARYGTPSIMWSVDTQDWKHPGVNVVISRVVDRAKSGSIILLHDIHASTLAAVEGVVSGLQARGFRLVTVSELIAMGRRAAGAAPQQAEPSGREGITPLAQVTAPAVEQITAADEPASEASAAVEAAPAAEQAPEPEATAAEEPAKAAEHTEPPAESYDEQFEDEDLSSLIDEL